METIKDFELLKAKLQKAEESLEEERTKMEKILSQEQERSSTLEEESYNRSSEAMRLRIKQLEEHYKALIH